MRKLCLIVSLAVIFTLSLGSGMALAGGIGEIASAKVYSVNDARKMGGIVRDAGLSEDEFRELLKLRFVELAHEAAGASRRGVSAAISFSKAAEIARNVDPKRSGARTVLPRG